MTVPSVHPAGLARIILINSYIHSETGPDFFEFDFQGHTQVNGANGSGKTSLLNRFFMGLNLVALPHLQGLERTLQVTTCLMLIVPLFLNIMPELGS